jgi:hydrogenase maturation protease
MSRSLVDRIVAAVLYEGYLLYPYRASAVKNRQRWTFGGVVPQAYSRAQDGTEPWTMQTQCLIQGGAATTLLVQVRFLHLLERFAVGQEHSPEPAWQEAIERDVGGIEWVLGDLVRRPERSAFSFLASDVIGDVRRRQQAVEGIVECSAEEVRADGFKITVHIRNLTPLEGAATIGRDEAMLRAFVSTHTILGVRNGQFQSLIDPPEEWREAAAACRNEGAFPVLIGEPGASDTILSSPIVLYDYPQVAPESPGDFFDATEIDEMLTLRILTMTEEE